MSELNLDSVDFSDKKSVFVWSPRQAAEFRMTGTGNPTHRFRSNDGRWLGFTEIPDSKERLEALLRSDPEAKILGQYIPGKSEISVSPRPAQIKIRP